MLTAESDRRDLSHCCSTATRPERRAMTKVTRLLLVRHLTAATVLLPLCALAVCFSLSLYLHFDIANHTHCRVYNFFPSISSAAGKFAPQKFIWRALLALHLAPRLLLARLYAGYLAGVLRQTVDWRRLAHLSLAMSVLELAGLAGVSFVGSTESYALHKVSLAVFLVASLSYMLLLTALLARGRRLPATRHECVSLRWKVRLLVCNAGCLVSAMYLFVRHNAYCEPGVYSAFAIFETCLVLSNMAFHATSYWDFHDLQLCVSSLSED